MLLLLLLLVLLLLLFLLLLLLFATTNFFHCRPLFLVRSIFVMDVHVVPSVVVDGHVPCKELVFNLDENLVLLGPNHRWTWHPRSEKNQKPIRKTKLVFTCRVATDAPGNLIFLQLIWEGATGAVHAKVDAENPKIIQYHQHKSHFQNDDMYKCLVCTLVVACRSFIAQHSTLHHSNPCFQIEHLGNHAIYAPKA